MNCFWRHYLMRLSFLMPGRFLAESRQMGAKITGRQRIHDFNRI